MISVEQALSLEPTGAAEKRMKAGRGRECEIEPPLLEPIKLQ